MAGLEDFFNQLFGGQQQSQQQYQTQQQKISDFNAAHAPGGSSYTGGPAAGYRQATNLEKFLVNTQKKGVDWTRQINKMLGIADENGDYDILADLKNIGDFYDENGQVDFGKVVTTPFRGIESASRVARALPGMMVQGWTEAPTYLYSAATGSPIAQDEGMNEQGYVQDKTLDAGQRLGSAVYGALNVVPVGWGAAGTKIGGAIARPLVRSATGQALKYGEAQAVKKLGAAGAAALGEDVKMKAGRAALGQAIGQSIEEGLEEGVQQVGQNILNDRPWDEQLAENIIGGAFAGGVMGGIKGPLMSAKFNRDTATFRNGLDGDEINSGNTTQLDQNEIQAELGPDQIGQRWLASPEEELEAKLRDRDIVPDSYTAIGYSRPHNEDNVDGVRASIDGLAQISENESLLWAKKDAQGNTQQVSQKLNTYFADLDFDGRHAGKTFAEQYRDAIQNNQLDVFEQRVNEYISQSNRPRLRMFLGKQPGGTKGIAIAVDLIGVNARNFTQLSQVGAIVANADFDSDRYVLTVDDQNRYGSGIKISELMSSEDTLGEIKDFKEAIALTDDLSRIKKELGNLYTTLKVNENKGDHLSKKDFLEAVEYRLWAIYDGKKETEPKISDSLKEFTELPTFSSVFQMQAYLQRFASPKISKQERIAEGSKFFSQVSRFNDDPIQNAADTVAEIAEVIEGSNVFQDEAPSANRSPVFKDHETEIRRLIEMTRKRFFISGEKADSAVRENQMLYFLIHDTILITGQENPTLTGEDLNKKVVESLVSLELGFEANALTPFDLTSGVISSIASNEAFETYSKEHGNSIKIENKDDFILFKKKLEESWNKYKKAYEAALEPYSTKGFLASKKSWNVPEMTDANADEIALMALGDKNIKDIFGITTGNSENQTVSGFINYIYNDKAQLVHTYSLQISSPLVSEIINPLIMTKVKQDEKTQSVIRGKIAETITGLSDILSYLKENGLSSWRELNAQDQEALFKYVCALSYWAGRKDFTKLGWNTFEAFMETQTNRNLVEGLLSKDVDTVIASLEAVSFNSKLGKSANILTRISGAIDGNPTVLQRLESDLELELDKLANLSPLYRKIVQNLNTLIMKPLADGNTELAQKNIDAILGSENGWLYRFLHGYPQNKMKSTINELIGQADETGYASADADLVYALSSAQDVLNIQTPASRNRTAVIYASFAVDETAARLKAEADQLFAELDNNAAAKDPQNQVLIMNALALNQELADCRFNFDAMFYMFDTSKFLQKGEIQKTSAIAAGNAFWMSGAVEDLGYAATEANNFNKTSLSWELLVSNPQLAAKLILTDYIYEAGGITITALDGRLMYFSSREELVGAWINEDISRGNLRIDHLRKICEKCPMMIRMISPVSLSYEDTDTGYTVKAKRDPSTNIAAIASEVCESQTRASGDSYETRLKDQLRLEKWKSWLSHNVEGIQLFCLSFEDIDGFYREPDQMKRKKILADHLDKVVKWLDYWSQDGIGSDLFEEEFNNCMERSLEKFSGDLGAVYKAFADFTGEGSSVGTLFESILDRTANEADDAVNRNIMGKMFESIISPMISAVPSRFQAVLKESYDINVLRSMDKETVKEKIREAFAIDLNNIVSDIFQPNVDDAITTLRYIYGILSKKTTTVEQQETEFYKQYAMRWMGFRVEDLNNFLDDMKATISTMPANTTEEIADKQAMQGVYDAINEMKKDFFETVDLDNLANAISKRYNKMMLDYEGTNGASSIYAIVNDLIDQKGKLSESEYIKISNRLISLFKTQWVPEASRATEEELKKMTESPSPLTLVTDTNGKPVKDANGEFVYKWDDVKGYDEMKRFLLLCLSDQLDNTVSGNPLFKDHFFTTLRELDGFKESIISQKGKAAALFKEKGISHDARSSRPPESLTFNFTSKNQLIMYDKVVTGIMKGVVEQGVQINASGGRGNTAFCGDYAFDLRTMDSFKDKMKSEEDYSNRTYQSLFDEWDNTEDKRCFYGMYSEDNGKTWKQLTPDIVWQMRYSQQLSANSPLLYFTLLDECSGFDTDHMVKSSNGRPFNHFLNILSKGFIINAAEALAIKVAKTLDAFDHASFSNFTDGEREFFANLKKGSDAYSGIPDSAGLVRELRKQFKDAKSAYSSLIYKMAAQGARKELDLSKADCIVFADHVVQCVRVEFNGGKLPARTIMLRDLLLNDPATIFSQEEIEAGVKGTRIHVSTMEEIQGVFWKDQFAYARQNSQNDLDFDSNDIWKKAFAETAKTYQLEFIDDMDEKSKQLSSIFSRCSVINGRQRNVFKYPENKERIWNEAVDAVNNMTPAELSTQNLHAIAENIRDNFYAKKNKTHFIARVYRGNTEDIRNFNEIESNRGSTNGHFNSYWDFYIDRTASDEDIIEALSDAARQGANVLFENSDEMKKRINNIMIREQIIFKEDINENTDRIKRGDYETVPVLRYTYSAQGSNFGRKQTQAGYYQVGDLDDFMFVFSPYATSGDGAGAIQTAGLKALKDAKPEPVQDYLPVGKLADQYVVEGIVTDINEINSIDPSKFRFDDAMSLVGGKAEATDIPKITAAFDHFKQNIASDPQNFDTGSGLLKKQSAWPNYSVIGVMKAKAGSGKTIVYIPMIVKTVQGQDLEASVSGSAIVWKTRSKLFDQYGNGGLFKFFLPEGSIKYTSVLSLAEKQIDHFANLPDGKALAMHMALREGFNGGKALPETELAHTYTLFLRRMERSMWGTVNEKGDFVIRKDLFGSDWSPEDIQIFFTENQASTRYCDLILQIAKGEKKFATLNGNQNKFLSLLAWNCWFNRADFKEVLSGVTFDIKLEDLASWDSLDEIKIPNNRVFKRKMIYSPAIVFGNFNWYGIQHIFSAVSPDDFASSEFDEIGSTGKPKTFDYRGRMLISWTGGGKPERMYVLFGKPRMDDTSSEMKSNPAAARDGRKMTQLARFTTGEGSYGDNRLELAKRYGLGRSIYEYIEDTKLEATADMYTDYKKNKYLSMGNFIAESQDIDQEFLKTAQRQERTKVRNEFRNGKIRIKNEDNELIKLDIDPDDKYRFVSEDLNVLKSTFLSDLGLKDDSMTANEFMLFLKTILAATEDTKNSEEDRFTFYKKDLTNAVKKAVKNLKETGLFVTREPIYEGGGGYRRFGMGILPIDIAQWAYKNCSSFISSRGYGSFDQWYEGMLEEFGMEMTNAQKSSNKAQIKSLFELARYCSIATPIENSKALRLTLADMTLEALMSSTDQLDLSLFGEMFEKFPELRNWVEEAKKAVEKQRKLVEGQNWDSYDLSGKGNMRKLYKEGKSDQALKVFIDRLCTVRQTMAIAHPMLYPASLLEKSIFGNATRLLLHKGLIDVNGSSVSPYRSNIGSYWSQQEVESAVGKIKQISKDNAGQKMWATLKEISYRADFTQILDLFTKHGNVQNALAEIGDKGLIRKISDKVFGIASASNRCLDVQIDVFLTEFLRRASLDPDLEWIFTSGWFFEKLEMDPEGLMIELFKEETRPLAEQAFNVALQGDAAERSLESVLWQMLAKEHNIVRLLTQTAICPFVQYGINISKRALKTFTPYCTIYYMILDHLKNSNADIPFIHILNENGEKVNVKWSDLGIDQLQINTSIQEAMRVDAYRLGAIGLATMLVALSGVLEPPDDDDKWCNIDEWTFFGQRIAENWWIQDVIGPTLGLAAMWKSALNGKPNLAVFINNAKRCFYANPLMRSGDLVNMLIDPYGSYMESYYRDLDTFSKARDGQPSGMDVLNANLSIFAINWGLGFCTPSIVKEIYQKMNPYEVSYKKIYEETDTGQLTEAGRNGATQYTTYFDQKLRQATRQNPILGWLCDTILNPNTGYLASEMPRTVYYDPAQMDSFKRLSIYTTDENGVQKLKSEQELNAIALEVIYNLQAYDDMNALVKSGFAIPYDTLKYVSNVVWDIASGSDEFYQSLIDNGTLDYYSLGNGNYEKGKAIAEHAEELYNLNYKYWKSFYYDKLWSDPIRKSLVTYNRYNTTYAQDANGEWYATGLRHDLSSVVSPVLTAPGSHSEFLGIDSPDSTMGYAEDWDTRSVVTGGSTGERALVPYVKLPEIPDWDSLGGNGGNGGNGYGYGGYGYGGSGGGGGGGGYSSGGSFRYNAPNFNFATTSPYITGADTPAVRTTNLQYTNRDYLRPGFETKGSRKAYKREDI